MSTKKKSTSTQTNTAAAWAQPSITSSLSGLDAASQVSSGNAAAVQPALMQAVNTVTNGITNQPNYMTAAGNQLTSTINGGSTNPYTSQLANYNTANPYQSQTASYDTSNPYADQLAHPDTSGITGGGTNQYIQQLASGQNDYIDQLMDVNKSTNPYAGAMADQLGQKTGANYAASFGTAGRSGSGLAALLGTQGIGDTLNSFYSNQYSTDQGYRNSALTTAAQLKEQALAQAAGYQDSQLSRQQQAQIAAAQLQQQGLTSAGQLQDSANGRGLTALTAAGQMADSSNARGLQGLTTAGGLQGDDLNRQLSAAGQASSLYGGSLQGISPLLSLAQTSTMLPLQGASAYSGAVGQLTQPYGSINKTGTETTSGLGALVGPGMQLAGMLTKPASGLSGLLGGSLTSGLSSGFGNVANWLPDAPVTMPVNQITGLGRIS